MDPVSYCFCDSPSKAYLTEIYHRTRTNDRIIVGLVFSKAINVPKKKLRTRRLELLFVLIVTRSLRVVAKAMR